MFCTLGCSGTDGNADILSNGCTSSLPVCFGGVCVVCSGTGGDPLNPNSGCTGLAPSCNPVLQMCE